MANPNPPFRTIHFFTKGDRNSASSRQRAYNVADKLVEMGLDCKVHQPFVRLLNKTKWPAKGNVIIRLNRCLGSIKRNDIIYLQRTVYSNYFIIILLFHRLIYKRKLVFDFDDAIYFHFPKQMKWLTRSAHQVIVGSHLLQHWAGQYNSNVHLIPTAIDYGCYSKYSIQYKQPELVTIGWIGHGPDNYENLALLPPVLRECAHRNLKIRLLVIGSLGSEKVKSLFTALPGITTDFVDTLNWSESDIIPDTIKALILA